MAITFLGLTIGDDGTGFVIPTLAALRNAFANYIREKSGIANLNTSMGSLYGDQVDMVAAGAEVAQQNAYWAVARTVFSAMQGVALDQYLVDLLTRVMASASEATVWVYGAAGAAVPPGATVATSLTSQAFAFDAGVVVPAAPAAAYGVEIKNFIAGTYTGQPFTLTVNGFPVVFVPNGADTGGTTRNGLVTAVNLLLLSQGAFAGGQSPTNQAQTLLVIESGGGGPFPLSVAGPAGAIVAFPAVAGAVTSTATGPIPAPAGALRFGANFANVQGYVNVSPAVAGANAETDSQFRARHLITQRGLGGGSPDAIRGIMLQSVAAKGGGATYCNVEYNPNDDTDAVGNVGHSVRVVVNPDANAQAIGNALFRGKAAGDNVNGPEAVIVTDTGVPPATHTMLIDRLTDQWVAVDVTIVVGEGWPNVGSPVDQLRQDIVTYIEALQGGVDVLVNALPISNNLDGTPRGVVNFTVRLGIGPQGGPYVYGLVWPTNPNAAAASVVISPRFKARSQISNVVVTL